MTDPGEQALRLRDYLDADWRRLAKSAGAEPARRRFMDNFSPRFAPVFFVRLAQRCHEKGWRRSAKLFSLLNVVLFSLEVPARLSIGPGLVIPHPFGTIIGAARIGRNATIYQQVTFGAALADYDYDPSKRPQVGNDVTVTAGAKVLGPVIIADGAIIGANAVVLKDVPAHSIAIGVPAQIREKEPLR